MLQTIRLVEMSLCNSAARAESRPMRLALNQQTPARAWQIFAAGCVAAFLLAIALSTAPRLHDQIHGAQGAEHTCVVTLISSGGCDHFTLVAPSGIPVERAPVFFVHAAESISPVALFESSILEHAPPRLA